MLMRLAGIRNVLPVIYRIFRVVSAANGKIVGRIPII